MNILNIICDENFNEVDWLLQSANGMHIEKANNQTLESLAQKIDFKTVKIHLLIASPQITFFDITIPNNISKSMINKVIPALLEDDLLAPIESIHFVVVKKVANKVTVALLGNEKLQEWLGLLERVGIKPHAIVPLCLLLNTSIDTCSIFLRKELAIVKVDEDFSFMVEVESLPMILQAHYSKMNTLPKTIILFNSDDETAVKPDFSQYLELQALIERPSLNIWQTINTDVKKGNLIAAPEAFSLEGETSKQLFVHGVAMLLFIFILSLTFEIINIVKINNKQAILNDEIAALYKEVYPQATQIISPEQRIQSELKALTGVKSGSFYDLLFSVGRTLIKNPNIVLQTARFKNEKFNIEIESKAYNDIDKFIAELKKTSLTIKQDKTEQQGKIVKASISIGRAK